AEGDQRAEKRSDLSYCKQLIQTESSGDWKRHETRHKKVQFVRISHFSQGELEMMLRKANKIVGYCDYLDKRMPSGYSTISLCSDELGLRDPDQKIDYSWIYELLDAIDKDSEVIVNLGDADYSERLQSQSANDVWQRANESPDAGTSRSCSRYLEFKWDMKIRDLRLNSRQPLKSWNLPPIYVACDGLTLREFSRAWEDNAVVVATGLLDDCDLQQWKPNTLLTTINVLSADVFEMGSKMRSSSSWPLDQFLQLFGESCAKLTARDRQKWTKCNDVLLSARRRACVKPKKEDEVERPDQAPTSEGGNGPGSRQPSKGKGKAKAKSRSKGKASAASVYAGSGRSAGGCLDIGETRDGDTAKGGRDRSTKRDEKRKENEMQDKVKATEFLKKKLDAVLQKVPFSEYTSKNGSLNLVNRLPEPYARPNLDPELQLTYGNSGVGSRDNLRCEVADMVNVLVYASSKADLDYSALNNIHQVKASRGRPRKINPAAAKEESSNKTRDESADDKDAVVVQWDIFPAEATETIGEFKQNSSNTNVVYDQSAFLDDRDLQRMYREYGDEARCFRVYQRVGDAVFVPAGCA
ncbi:Lysine-specific demethylase 3B, partial [Coemansia sp. RSA 2598]